MEVVYSRARPALHRGQRYQNPRYFAGVVEGATSVRIEGDWPVIASAYEAAGVPVNEAPVKKARRTRK